jgi:hypothetical protein
MRDDFCAFILTHGRPDRQFTLNSLEKRGYTGPVFFVVDDEDATLPEYQRRYGTERVLTFSKSAIAETFDEGDNSGDRRAIVYARNACWEFARRLGYRFFIQLDDDYVSWGYRFNARAEYVHSPIASLDDLFDNMATFLEATPFLSVAISQGGDHLGGGRSSDNKKITTKRKAMNTFVCMTDRPFTFVGRINEDVNTYTSAQRAGGAFITFYAAMVTQVQTQSNAGGMTDLYLDSGTYIKSFYTIMYAPSCTVVTSLIDHAGASHTGRIHHKVKWQQCAPKIIPETFRKARSA